METAFSHYKSYEKIFRRSRAANSVVSGPIWPKFELVRDYMDVLVIYKYKKDRIKTTEKTWRHHFPHYKSMGVFCCYGNQSSDIICSKILCSLSLTPVMLHIKFDQDWPTGFIDIQVWKCGRRTTTTTDGRTTDHWYTISSPCEPSAQVNNKTIGITLFQIYLTSATSSILHLIVAPRFISNERSNPCVHFSFNYSELNCGSLVVFYNKSSKFAICQCPRNHIRSHNHLYTA